MKRYLGLIVTISLMLVFLTSCSGKFDFSSVKSGDIISFGKYEQDNDSTNGTEPIEWKVLNVDNENRKALIISKKAIEAFAYEREKEGDSWQDYSLRKWLNNDFYTQAFDDDEKDYIVESPTKTENYSSTGILGSQSTTMDNVFLLSLDEVMKYSNLIGICYPTDYVKERLWQELFYMDSFYDGDGCYWWLSDPGAHTSIREKEFSSGRTLTRGIGGVRPALYINIS